MEGWNYVPILILKKIRIEITRKNVIGFGCKNLSIKLIRRFLGYSFLKWIKIDRIS